MSTTRAPSVIATEADRASVAATSAIEIPDISESGLFQIQNQFLIFFFIFIVQTKKEKWTERKITDGTVETEREDGEKKFTEMWKRNLEMLPVPKEVPKGQGDRDKQGQEI